MENRFLPFAPVDFRRKPEPVPRLKSSLGYNSVTERVRYMGLLGFMGMQAGYMPARARGSCHQVGCTANLCTKILDFRGFDLSRILISRGGIPRPIRKLPESLSQAILAGMILVGRLGVAGHCRQSVPVDSAAKSADKYVYTDCTLVREEVVFLPSSCSGPEHWDVSASGKMERVREKQNEHVCADRTT